jgi:hypothetical protein
MVPRGSASLRIGALLGAGIVTGIATFAGLLLFIVPGFFLLASWMMVAPILIGEGADIGTALRESWNRTRGQVLPIALAAVLVYLPMIAAMGAIFLSGWQEGATGSASVALDTLSNVLLYLSTVGGYVLAVATYRLLAPEGGQLRDIFA